MKFSIGVLTLLANIAQGRVVGADLSKMLKVRRISGYS